MAGAASSSSLTTPRSVLSAWAPLLASPSPVSSLPFPGDSERLPLLPQDIGLADGSSNAAAAAVAAALSSTSDSYARHLGYNNHLHSHTVASSVSPLVPALLPPVTLASSSPSSLLDLPELVRDFWSAFPCPPPWRPRLLAELNASSRLEPSVGRRVQAFLAGKCHLQHIFSASDLHPAAGLDLLTSGGHGEGDLFDDLSRSNGGIGGNGVLSSEDAPSPHAKNHSWCDSGCQLGLACAVVLAVVMVLVVIVVFLSRHRRTSKMAATRPSRQHLQMSTSVSDTANCTEFSNLEIQTDDEASNPFRFRGLPHPPPSLCLNLTYDPHGTKWTYPNCSTFHPMIRMGQAGEYYSYPYSAVYETIDDDDDDDDEEDADNDTTKNVGVERYANSGACMRSFHSSQRGLAATSRTPCSCSSFQQLPEHLDGACRETLLSLEVFDEHHHQHNPDHAKQFCSMERKPNPLHSHCTDGMIIRNMQADGETEFNGGGSNGDVPHGSQPQVAFRPLHPGLRDIPGGTQEIAKRSEKETDYTTCSGASRVSSGSVSSRVCAVGSPYSLSAAMNDLCSSGDLCPSYEDAAAPTTGNSTTQEALVSTRPCFEMPAQANACSCVDQVHRNGYTNDLNPGDAVKIGQLIISSNSAFYSPKTNTPLVPGDPFQGECIENDISKDTGHPVLQTLEQLNNDLISQSQCSKETGISANNSGEKLNQPGSGGQRQPEHHHNHHTHQVCLNNPNQQYLHHHHHHHHPHHHYHHQHHNQHQHQQHLHQPRCRNIARGGNSVSSLTSDVEDKAPHKDDRLLTFSSPPLCAHQQQSPAISQEPHAYNNSLTHPPPHTDPKAVVAHTTDVQDAMRKPAIALHSQYFEKLSPT